MLDGRRRSGCMLAGEETVNDGVVVILNLVVLSSSFTTKDIQNMVSEET